MGCTGSKQDRRWDKRSARYSGRSHSLPFHNGNGVATCRRAGKDSHAVAALQSVLFDRCDRSSSEEARVKSFKDVPAVAEGRKELSRIKTWPEKTDRQIATTSPHEPEVIDVWEIMADLEDASPVHLSRATPSLRSPPPVGTTASDFNPKIVCTSSKALNKESHQSGSYPDTQPSGASSSPNSPASDIDPEILSAFEKAINEPLTEKQSCPSPNPELPVNFIASSSDREILSAFNKALNEASPQHQSHSILQPPVMHNYHDDDDDCNNNNNRTSSKESIGCRAPNQIGIAEARIKEFQGKIDAKKNRGKANSAKVSPSPNVTPGSDGEVVLYFTSLRGIRRTFEECLAARLILKGYGVRVDERDVSMDAGYKEELIRKLGPGRGSNTLPRVFADGKYLGGAEEVRQLHDAGRLGELLECCEMASPQEGDGAGGSCEACGDVRFVPCTRCSGSCKVYREMEEEDGGLEGFWRCPDCNENGLVRCPFCC
ncbi:hypothetical protein Cni_G25935 [Canna indica]|uniref:Glutaredoxin domain-containing protein n=1 Tax=Canna indica TaxID=4628 RepID=A0AAQ3QPX5_9LILI|nr:hypothetical protein Cni_G25935 [Canna indica]